MEPIDESALRRSLNSLIEVKRSNLGCEVQLPVVYPNGELVSVTVAVEAGRYLVHDAGNGVMFLNTHGVDTTKKTRGKLERIAAHYGCAFLSGRMERACTQDELAVCITVVANASRSVGDQLLEQGEKPIVDFRRAALEKVHEAVGSNRYRENEEVIGDSGYAYRVSAVILTPDASKPLCFIEPIKDHESLTKKFREFYDIKKSSTLSDIGRIALYDDKRTWNSSDILLLQDVSNPVRISDAGARLSEIANVRPA